MFADANAVDRLLVLWKKAMCGYQTRFDVIEHMLQDYDETKVENAINEVGKQQAISPVGVDTLIDRVNALLEKGKQ